jgi:CRISPR-associated endonuclease/helicase Cas3
VTYWAHSDPAGFPSTHPNARWQLLADHLAQVRELAAKLAYQTRPEDEHFASLAGFCGLLHDFGKYSQCFQDMIVSGHGKCQHSIHGAAIAYCGATSANDSPRLAHIAAAIAGHHAGLPDFSGGESSLDVRIKNHLEDARGLVQTASSDSSIIQNLLHGAFPPPDRPDKSIQKQQFDLYTRMLFSCLVDADRLDTSGRSNTQSPLLAAERLQKLLVHISEIPKASQDGCVKNARKQVLEDCLAAASQPERLFSLSVPTGGGKTLASMAFALQRAALAPEQYRRIIVVIPYLSIIEQNAQVYAQVFGHDAVLEHHSGAFDKLHAERYGEEGEHYVPVPTQEDEQTYRFVPQRPEAENWDHPLIVTTSVRFFEGLFSNRPSDLRRAHNIARSIIILDEVQTLPRRLLAPLLSIMKELSQHWGCTFVFSSATLPAFQRPAGSQPDARWGPNSIREIVRGPDILRASLKRVDLTWELDQPLSWERLAQRMLDKDQALCIVNLRDHASLLYDELLRQTQDHGADTESIFHLSTRMCAAHRLNVLKDICKRLREKLPCRVVATQLVEAGVDFDFPVVFRALAPFDSIVQAAGRADREGLLTAKLGRPGGRVVIFLSEDGKLPPNEYKQATEITKALAQAALHNGESLQVGSTEAMQVYFERYYGEGACLGEELQKLRSKAMFSTLADKFEMINTRTRDVFVPYDAKACQAIKELWSIRRLTRDLRQRLQRYVVGLNPGEFRKASGVLTKLTPESEVWITADSAYDKAKGMKFALTAEDCIA